MIKKHLLSICIALLLFSCAPDREKTLNEIKVLESKFSGIDKRVLDLEAGIELFEKYDTFLEYFPEDSLSGELQFEAGKLAVALNNHTKAINYLEAYIAKYSDTENAPQAYLLLGNYYANKVYDFEQAEITFNKFISQYPNHAMTKDVAFMIKTLGKTPLEIIEMVQQDESPDKDSI